ncbi:MAG TPA: hypothetical protein VKT72_02840 [Candidatus Baltobacteraceae bacterium]|nr:hypothetical protein [Candidatus Baltobacteraceae bacterium]
MNLSLQSTNAYNPFANLNLSSAQQTQVQSILSGAQSQGESFSQVQGQVQSILNPAQQQTFQADLAQLKGHSGHHHGHHGGGESSAATDVLSPSYVQAAAVQSETDPTVNGLTAADLQNQALASQAISQSQLQNTLLQSGTAQF